MRILRIIRITLITLLILSVALPASMYLMLSSDWMREKLRDVTQTELSRLMDTRVEIDRLAVYPFNRLAVSGVRIYDDADSLALDAAGLKARFELWHFISTGKIVIDYVKIESPKVHLWKKSPHDPLNITKIINALKKEDKEKPPTRFALRVESFILENGAFRYDVYSEPHLDGRFDKNHISVNSLNLNVFVPMLSNDCISLQIERFRFNEKSGFVLQNLQLSAALKGDSIDVRGLDIALPHSYIKFHPTTASIKSLKSLNQVQDPAPKLELSDDSYVCPADFSAFLPSLATLTGKYNLSFAAEGTLAHVNLSKLQAASDDGLLSLSANGELFDLAQQPNILSFKNLDIDLKLRRQEVFDVLSALSPSTALQGKPMRFIADVMNLHLQANGTLHEGKGVLNLNTSLGDAEGNVEYAVEDSRNFNVVGNLILQRLKVGQMASVNHVGEATGTVDFNLGMSRGVLAGDVDADIQSFEYKGFEYNNITAQANIVGDSITVDANVDDQLLKAKMQAHLARSATDKKLFTATANARLREFYPNALGLVKSHPGYRMSGTVDFTGAMRSVDEFEGVVDVRDFKYQNPAGDGLDIKKFNIDANCMNQPGEIVVESDILNGSIDGVLALSTIVPTVKDMVSHVFPTYISQEVHHKLLSDPNAPQNDFLFDFTISNANRLCDFLSLPIHIVYPISISGFLKYPEHKAFVSVDVPYLQQGDKIIDGTALVADIDGNTNTANLNATTRMPTKKGPMRLDLNVKGHNNTVNTDIDWVIERAIPLNGKIKFDTRLERRTDEDGNPLPGSNAYVDILPGKINFGDDVWNISPATIKYYNKDVIVDNLHLATETQAININGTAGDSDDEVMRVDLKNINLINIFENLEIDKALIGGHATGTVFASRLLTKEPDIRTNDLHVDSISYNYCVIGDADIKANFDVDKKSFHLDADIVEPGGLHSRIYGDIMPATEELDIYFDANHVKVGFMQPFMDAFAADINGYATGKAHLFGTFKYIDLEGDVYAQDLSMRIKFTNTVYTTTDSVHMRPGRIDIKDVTVKDRYGNTALVNGVVKHEFFKEPVFDFAITQARNFLIYDVSSAQNPDWYGRIFGNGAAFVKGEPGLVDIRVNMSTARNSIFTFVLSDNEVADEYSFITFRERKDLVQVRDTILEVDDVPREVREYQKRMAARNIDEPSDYRMDIQVDITPEAKVVLVMDPVGGDAIKTNGKGNLRMTYSSSSGLLNMYGTYTLEKGTYNFTLQDIIIKDFAIKEGSSIAFHGSPYETQLDIVAYYSVNANLSDLDESFLLDKDLNRTNVPVHALLKVTGDMRQPDIDFDLEFPTLTSDTYRKVRSIISTEDMMNRQIIYLLALNRFYTPDYMNTTKGNEIFSVASSTISSQISSMLGKLSENWSIAPNLRSDRGDFSDIEVDVALSSRLLKNRLLINGNFGYRDKSLNTNQFVGDFDLEYLINRSGTWRLKAYNRYNDQNYYLRTAATTQGVGLMFRRDFDGMFNFLNSSKKTSPAVNTDSLKIKSPAVAPDSILVPKVSKTQEVDSVSYVDTPKPKDEINKKTKSENNPALSDDWLIIR